MACSHGCVEALAGTQALRNITEFDNMPNQGRCTYSDERRCADSCCCSRQGTFDGEVVKILKFYGDKKRELLARLDELQTDIDALPTQVTLSLALPSLHTQAADVKGMAKQTLP